MSELDDGIFRWLLEQTHRDFLNWVALWLACMLGMVTILTSITSKPDTLNTSTHFYLLSTLYWGLVIGTIFSVIRLTTVVKHGVVWMNKIKAEALKKELSSTRGWLSSLIVRMDGTIRSFYLSLTLILHFGFALAFYLSITFRYISWLFTDQTQAITINMDVFMVLQNANVVGLLFEIVGVAIILYGQINFCKAAKKQYGSVKKALIHMSGARLGSDVERLKEMSEPEANKLFEKFPLAKLIRDDIKISVFGMVISLIGLIIEIAAPIL